MVLYHTPNHGSQSIENLALKNNYYYFQTLLLLPWIVFCCGRHLLKLILSFRAVYSSSLAALYTLQLQCTVLVQTFVPPLLAHKNVLLPIAVALF